MYRKTLNRLVIFAASVVIALLTAACDSGAETDDGGGNGFDRSAMLANVADTNILPAYERLSTRSTDLAGAVQDFEASPDLQNLVIVREALKAARLAWQNASLFQFGPAESVALRASVNTYPVDTGQVETNIRDGAYTLGTVQNRAAGGFPTMGYLLNRTGASDAEIVETFTTDPDAAERTAYLVANAAFVDGLIQNVVEAWRADGDDYRSVFLSEGRAGTDVGSSLGMMINALVLHFERFLRDGKIGIPSGVRSAGVPRPASTEAFYGGYSVELAVENARAVNRLFLGNSLVGSSGTGLDDHLSALGGSDLADEIELQILEAIAVLESLNDPLSNQIDSDNDNVLAAFTALQDVTVVLKADMTSILGVTITFQDNDGD